MMGRTVALDPYARVPRAFMLWTVYMKDKTDTPLAMLRIDCQQEDINIVLLV